MACHAKQLEAKRTLDGIATKVMLLSDEIEGQEAVIAGQNKMVQDMLEQGSRSAESKKAEHHQCNLDYNESWDALQRYRDEIFELHNIAFPKHRSKARTADRPGAPPSRFSWLIYHEKWV